MVASEAPSLLLGTNGTKIGQTEQDVIDRLCTISDWSLLKRVVVRIHRLAQGATTDQPLTVQEVDDSGKRVLRLIQHDSSSL